MKNLLRFEWKLKLLLLIKEYKTPKLYELLIIGLAYMIINNLQKIILILGFSVLITQTFFFPPRYAESTKNHIRISPEEYCGVLVPNLSIWDSYDSGKNLRQREDYKKCLNERPIDSFLLLINVFVIFLATIFLFLLVQNIQSNVARDSQNA